MKRDLLGVVLCGGESSRMGVDKAAIEVCPGVSQLERQLSLLEPFCSRLAACVGPSSRPGRALPKGVAAVRDADDVEGPMGGVIAALRLGAGLPVLALACDMLYVESSHLVQLLNRRDPQVLATAFVATDGLPDPMFCLYEASSLPQMVACAAAGRASLRHFLSGVPVERVVLPDSRFLASVNDPEQLSAARSRLGVQPD